MALLFPENETQRLAALHEHGILDTPPDEDFDDLVRLAAEACGVPIAGIVFIDGDRQWFKSKLGLEFQETRREDAFCAHTILSSGMMTVPDTLEDARFRNNPLVTGDTHVRFYAGVPLLTEEGYALGSLCVIDTTPRTLTPAQGRTLSILARQVAGHLKAARRVSEQKRLVAACAGLEADRERIVLEKDQLAEQRERSEAERLSAESERLRLAAIVESSDEAILAATLDDTIVSWNKGAERLFSYTSAEVIGQSTAVLAAASCCNPFLTVAACLLRGESVEPTEWTQVRRDGTIQDIFLSFSAIRDAGGSVVGLSATARDITARKKTEAALAEAYTALAESEARMRRLSDAAFEGVVVSQDGLLIDVSSAFAVLFGYDSPAQMLGLVTKELAAPRSRELAAQKIDAGSEEVYEAEMQRRDGTTFRAELRGRMIHIGGRPARVTAMRDITERAAMESALRDYAERIRRSESGLRAVLEGAPVILYSTDECGTVTHSEGMGLSALGLSPGEAVGHSVFEFTAGSPENEDSTRRALAGEAVSFDAQVGSFYLHTELRPLRKEDGSSAGLIGVCYDVTERVRSEERFRVLFEHSSDAHLLFDQNGIIDCNPAAVSLLRCSDKSQVLSLHPAVLSPTLQPDGRLSGEKSIEMDAAARERGGHRFEWTHRKMDGEEFPVEVALTPVTLGGRPVLLVVWHDLTERKQAEEALRASHEQRSESEARLRLALESGNLGSYDVNQATGEYLEVSSTYKAQFGLAADAEVSSHSIFAMIHSEDQALVADAVEKANAAGSSWLAEHRIAWNDGSIHWSRAHGLSICDENGQPTRMIGVTQDITERKALEAERERLSEREHKIASQLQAALQPPLPTHVPGTEVICLTQPALDEAEIGGDFHDCFALDDTRYALVIADVSGKGLAAAQQIALIRSSLRITLYLRHSPAQAAAALNKAVTEHELLVGFVTALVAVLDTDTGELVYCSCGHEPGLIQRFDGAMEMLGTTGPPLGLSEDAEYTESTEILSAGDTLLLYTDGLSEAGPNRRELLGTEGLMQMVAALPVGLSPKAEAETLVSKASAYANGVFRDDVTVLIARRQAASIPACREASSPQTSF